MKKTMRFLSIAALALVGAVMTGCSSDEEIVVVPVIETPQQPADNIVTLTTTIGFNDGGDATRALAIDDVAKKLTKTFAAGDQVAVIYKNTSDETVKALSTALPAGVYSSSAEITVTLTNPKPSTPVRFIYPAAMALDPATTDVVTDDAATVNYTALNYQDGTLATIGSTLDLAIYDGTLTSDAKLPEKLTLDNQLAICAYTLKDYATPTANDITGTITTFYITNGTFLYTVNRTAAAGPIYVAIRPITTATDISYEASDGTINYVKGVTGKQYAADNVYSLGLKMGNLIRLDNLTGDYEAQNGDVLTNTLDGSTKPYKITIADGAAVTLANATINGVHDGSYKWAGITCLGDATITLAGANTVKGFYTVYPSIHIATGKTLTIKGSGTLNASSNGYGCGIGGGYELACGNIKIENGTINATGGQAAAGIGAGEKANCGTITVTGGTITAMGGANGAGIGSGNGYSSGSFHLSVCGNILIDGGTITATGGNKGAGIGCGQAADCGTITITNQVTKVTATMGSSSDCSVGLGFVGTYCACGTITIGGTVYWDGSAYVGTGSTYLTQGTINYLP